MELKRLLTIVVHRCLAEWSGIWPAECPGCRVLAIAKCMSIANPEIDQATPEQRRLIIHTLREIVREEAGIPEFRLGPRPS